MLCSACISSVVASEFLPIVTGLVSYHSIKQNKAKPHVQHSHIYREGNALQIHSSLHCEGTNLKCVDNVFLLHQQASLRKLLTDGTKIVFKSCSK